jgi:hypothetical protein
MENNFKPVPQKALGFGIHSNDRQGGECTFISWHDVPSISVFNTGPGTQKIG